MNTFINKSGLIYIADIPDRPRGDAAVWDADEYRELVARAIEESVLVEDQERAKLGTPVPPFERVIQLGYGTEWIDSKITSVAGIEQDDDIEYRTVARFTSEQSAKEKINVGYKIFATSYDGFSPFPTSRPSGNQKWTSAEFSSVQEAEEFIQKLLSGGMNNEIGMADQFEYTIQKVYTK